MLLTLTLRILVTIGSLVEDLVALGDSTLNISSSRHLQLVWKNALLSNDETKDENGQTRLEKSKRKSIPCTECDFIRKSYLANPTGNQDSMSFRWSIRVQPSLCWDHDPPDKLALVRLHSVSAPRITAWYPRRSSTWGAKKSLGSCIECQS